MKISVFGLGYVGVVSAACLAADGHDVIGVDPNATKVDLIDRGIAPIVEEDIEALIASSVAAGRLSASMSVADAIQTDLARISGKTSDRQYQGICW